MRSLALALLAFSSACSSESLEPEAVMAPGRPALAPPVAEPPPPPPPRAVDAAVPAGPRVKLTWEVGPLRRLRKFVYRNDVDVVVHVSPPVRFRVRSIGGCGEVGESPWFPIPRIVQFLTCYGAGYGDYIVVAQDVPPSPEGDRYVVRAFGQRESEENDDAPPLVHLRTVGHFVAPHGATFEPEVTYPHGEGDRIRDDE